MRTAVITGAGSGIGAELARRLSRRGDHLVLLARSQRRAAEMSAEFPGAAMLVADLARPGDLPSVLDRASLPDRVDALVHAAGTIALGRVEELGVTAWSDQFAVNVTAPAELTKALLPALRRAGGRVVFVNSGAGYHARPQWGAYAASKHALRALADALRQEEQSNGVRVTSIHPGRTATPMQERVHRYEDRDYRPGDFISPESVAECIMTALDLGPDADLTEMTVRPG